MKQNKNIISLLAILFTTSVWAQNTTREPIQGTATNPVTQHEVDQSGEQKPLSELIKKKKPKTKKETSAEPDKTSTSTPPPNTTTPQDSTKPTTTVP